MDLRVFSGFFLLPDDKRSLQILVISSFLVAAAVYALITFIKPHLLGKYNSWKNTKSALQKTQMELAQSEKEFRIINEELAKQESIIRARKNVVKPQLSNRSKYSLVVPPMASIRDVTVTPEIKSVLPIGSQSRYSLASSQPLDTDRDSVCRTSASESEPEKPTKRVSSASSRAHDMYSRPPLPQPPSLESIRPRDTDLERRRDLIRQQDEAYAAAVAEDSRRMAAAQSNRDKEVTTLGGDACGIFL